MGVTLKKVVGSGDRIMLVASPFFLIGATIHILIPSVFSVGGPGDVIKAIAVPVLMVGIGIWMWCGILIVTKVPRGELITNGPYAIVKHPLYTSVALLVIPSLGLLLDSWLGVILGVIVYAAARKYAPEEEDVLSATFGAAWDAYCDRVRIPWL